MLLFYAADETTDLDAVAAHGLSGTPDAPLRLHGTLAAARRATSGPTLVVDPDGLGLDPTPRIDGPVSVPAVPPAAVQNLAPYRPPTPVTAGGGYVVRSLPDDAVALLLIHRRGVWDLPKGKQDPGEDVETCALREVQEEVGIDDLRLGRALDTTVHGYPDGDVYAVKTTHWYLMQTPERTFEPERREGIRRVAWARWPVARRHLGYDTLRRHMDRVEPDVRAALGGAPTAGPA
jgi:8-oxo-dGTP pyrophosphatase MutT (NUDIX family)